ncbi:amidohydrolase family protein [Dietzia psychralcaliphila]|uniref:amidohydrolase family protein n=1 Tax=Dietzia psychralcaliphila TaxID=139021 RepID=UPI0027DFEEFC|nr:amidohydrolase family protein [Dietzia psychralcaliphila]
MPGLHDHHIHLHALAATELSVDVGPPNVTSHGALADALRSAAGSTPPGGWIRAIGYHESVAGPLDRYALDDLELGVPVRVQHRSGALWILDSSALDHVRTRVAMDSHDVGRDVTGEPDGRFWRFDTRLRDGIPPVAIQRHRAALETVRDRLLGFGITGVTDATPDLESEAIDQLSVLAPIHVQLLGAPARLHLGPGLSRGPRKLLLRDHDLPDFDTLCAMIDPDSSGAGREAVAVHCVSRESLVLTIAALLQVGPHALDRIEHASIAPPDLDPLLVEVGVTVVTQPDFLRTRGDHYLQDVDPGDIECLYRWRSLEAAGVPVVASSDAPYGSDNPWTVVRSAASRETRGGRVLGDNERVPARRALESLLRPLDRPDSPARRIHVGGPADLCLLDRGVDDALEPDGDCPVRLTVVRGTVAAGS